MKKVNLSRIFIILLVSVVGYLVLLRVLVHFEQNNPDASITSFYDAIWWSMVTLTSVGYGDMYPSTEEGRIIGFFFLFGSLTIFAILIGQISSIMNNIKENKRLGQYGTNLKHHPYCWVEFIWQDSYRSINWCGQASCHRN